MKAVELVQSKDYGDGCCRWMLCCNGRFVAVGGCAAADAVAAVVVAVAVGCGGAVVAVGKTEPPFVASSRCCCYCGGNDGCCCCCYYYCCYYCYYSSVGGGLPCATGEIGCGHVVGETDAGQRLLLAYNTDNADSYRDDDDKDDDDAGYGELARQYWLQYSC